MIHPDDSNDKIIHLMWNTTSTALRYPGMNDATVSASIAVNQRWICPTPGSVVEVGIIGYTDLGSTTIGVHKNLNTTPDETQVVSPATAPPATIATFTSNSFAKGDVLSIGITPTNVGGNNIAWVRFRPS